MGLVLCSTRRSTSGPPFKLRLRHQLQYHGITFTATGRPPCWPWCPTARYTRLWGPMYICRRGGTRQTGKESLKREGAKVQKWKFSKAYKCNQCKYLLTLSSFPFFLLPFFGLFSFLFRKKTHQTQIQFERCGAQWPTQSSTPRPASHRRPGCP